MPNKRKTSERGYGAQHAALRRSWAHVVKEGRAFCAARTCLEPTRWIRPGTPWDLGHTPDRTAYTGPEHPRCNRSEGARRGNAKRSTKPFRRSRRW